jgi:hypothetical protein
LGRCGESTPLFNRRHHTKRTQMARAGPAVAKDRFANESGSCREMGAMSLPLQRKTKFDLTHSRISNLTATADHTGLSQRKRDVQRRQMVSPRFDAAWPVHGFPKDPDTHRKMHQKT